MDKCITTTYHQQQTRIDVGAGLGSGVAQSTENMRPPEQLDTTRLLLRRPLLTDAHEIYERYATDSEVTRFLVWRPHNSFKDTESFLERCVEVWDGGSAFPWILTLKESKFVIGMAELRIDGNKADVGYVLSRPFWGQGYMTEALRSIVEWGINQSSIYRVWAVCDIENKASARVLEKVGMRLEGILKRWIVCPNMSDEPRDSLCYAITK